MLRETKNSVIGLELDSQDQIAIINLQMKGKVNKINAEFVADLNEAFEWAWSQDSLAGVIITSKNADFCVGADLDLLFAQDNTKLQNLIGALCTLFRNMETQGKPVVAALNGSALGGGFEIALACHRRIAIADKKSRFGLPEVSLGVIPGAGGTQRLPRLVGIQSALENIVQARMLKADRALENGMVDELVSTEDELIPAAKKWIMKNPTAKQPWDTSNFKIRGPKPDSEDARNIFMATCAMVEKKTAGVFLAPKLAISSIQEGCCLTFDRAIEVENRYFFQAAKSGQAKNMIRTFWYHKKAAEKHEGLPSVADAQINKIGVIGAGMMGAGLASVFAARGFQVVLNDLSESSLNKAMEHCKARNEKPLAKCDLVIEAVFENMELKHQLTKEVEPFLHENAIWASNTSALPITDLAKVSIRPSNFIGLHFFSPPEKMQLVEIIMGSETSQDTLARCLAFSKSIAKLPIVVNDGYGFYTSRVFCSYVLEAAQLVAEGHDPVLIEWAAKKAGLAVPPLQVIDEVTLPLICHAMTESEKYWGKSELEGLKLLQTMVNLGRNGKAVKKGFYDYKNGKRQMWPGLYDLIANKASETGVPLLEKRLLLIQCAQVAQAIDEGILREYRDAEIGAIFGIGFAPQTGGPLSYMDTMGLRNVVKELENLTAKHGKRFAPSKTLVRLAEKGGSFFP